MNRSPLAEAFIEQATRHLAHDFLPKVRRCVGLLTEDEIWWRANENTNSVGNLILHLCGNVRQWIVSGLGSRPDMRERNREFAERGPIPGQELIIRLEATLKEAIEVLESLNEKDLRKKGHIQIYDVTGLQAVLHVVEHFSYHTGQIIYITRLKKNVDLKFYRL